MGVRFSFSSKQIRDISRISSCSRYMSSSSIPNAATTTAWNANTCSSLQQRARTVPWWFYSQNKTILPRENHLHWKQMAIWDKLVDLLSFISVSEIINGGLFPHQARIWQDLATELPIFSSQLAVHVILEQPRMQVSATVHKEESGRGGKDVIFSAFKVHLGKKVKLIFHQNLSKPATNATLPQNE